MSGVEVGGGTWSRGVPRTKVGERRALACPGDNVGCRQPALTRAALGSPAERAALGGGVNITPPPANSRTSSRSEAGEAAIEISQ